MLGISLTLSFPEWVPHTPFGTEEDCRRYPHTLIQYFMLYFHLCHHSLFKASGPVGFFFFSIFESFIEVELIYIVVIISAAQQSDSVLHIHTSILFFFVFFFLPPMAYGVPRPGIRCMP